MTEADEIARALDGVFELFDIILMPYLGVAAEAAAADDATVSCSAGSGWMR